VDVIVKVPHIFILSKIKCDLLYMMQTGTFFITVQRTLINLLCFVTDVFNRSSSISFIIC